MALLLLAACTAMVAGVATQGLDRALAQGASAEYVTKAKYAVVMDVESGAVLYQFNADQLVSPASMSKLMTLVMVFKALKERTITLDTEFVMSEYAWRTGGAPSRTSAMMVPLNTRTKVSELLRGVIVESGNDASIALAEGLAGSESAFARAMEEEARRIGLKKSTFRNATGLFHAEHLMTARELALIGRHIVRTYPDFYPMFAEKNFNYRNHKFINRNPLLFQGIGADGLKTGHLKDAGYGVVGSVVQNNRRLIAVVTGLQTEAERREESRRIFEWGFRAFGEFKLYEAGEIIGKAKVWGGDALNVNLIGAGELMVVLPKYPANQKLRAEIVYNGPLKAPVNKGDQIATLLVKSSNDAFAEVPLYAAHDVKSVGMIWRGLHSLYFMVTRYLPV
jgi:serine-type D-Ala-D-Ala carboxypeptidase (penicillin-binding protein 5/6)